MNKPVKNIFEALKSNKEPTLVNNSFVLDEFIDDIPDSKVSRPFYHDGVKYNSLDEFQKNQGNG